MEERDFKKLEDAAKDEVKELLKILVVPSNYEKFISKLLFASAFSKQLLIQKIAELGTRLSSIENQIKKSAGD